MIADTWLLARRCACANRLELAGAARLMAAGAQVCSSPVRLAAALAGGVCWSGPSALSALVRARCCTASRTLNLEPLLPGSLLTAVSLLLLVSSFGRRSVRSSRPATSTC